MLDIAKTTKLVDRCRSDDIVPTLVEYIKIPNKSPAFDTDWAARGYMDEAAAMFERWARAKLPSLPGATLEVVRLPGRTPVTLIEIPGDGADTVLLYDHLDKQPEMVRWAQGYGPWIPRLEGDKLYGRGGADDGYAMFGALSALRALKARGEIFASTVRRHRRPRSHSNAHGPNEFLHIPTGERVLTVIAQVLADHHAQQGRH
jgi:acetylornithine deacetylase/succinyl-diaminopimelate desuccinylase-like protein